MKGSSILFFAATVAAGVIEPRAECKLPSPGVPYVRKNAQRKFFSVGTYNLVPHVNPGKGGMGGMMGEADAQSFMALPSGSTFCGTCTVLAGQIKLFFPDGTPANISNGIYTHHILTNGMGSQPSFVNSGIAGFAGATGAGFVGAGDDNGNRPWVYAPTDGSFDSGFHLQGAATRFNSQIVLVNYNNVPKTVCVAYDLEYLPGLVGKKVKSSLISSSGLLGPKTSKARALNTTSSPMKFSESGHIVLAKGHLHDGGSAMYMTITGKNNHQCISKASYETHIGGTGAPTISDMSDCNEKPWRVDVGDSMVLTAEYDMKNHPGRNDGTASVMGMFRIIFAPDKAW